MLRVQWSILQVAGTTFMLVISSGVSSERFERPLLSLLLTSLEQAS